MSSKVEQILKDMGIDLNPKKEEEKTKPRRPEGYDSLISDEEFEAIEKVVQAFDNYIEVHNKCVVANADRIMQVTPYARIQYTSLADLTNDAIRSIGMMYDIHNMDKKTIDESMKDVGASSVKELEMSLLRSIMMKKMFG